jgi:NADH-quinone oxidoreductase subunit J
METLQLIVKIGVYVIMAVTVLAAAGAVTLPNIFHAALALIVALLGVAGAFIALKAEFLAAVQVLLYVGAVMTLVIFSIMMTERLADKTVPSRNNLSIPALLGSGLFLFVLSGFLYWTPWTQRLAPNTTVTTADLGKALLGQYVFPFEVISVFLIAALIGAIIIAKKDSQS